MVCLGSLLMGLFCASAAGVAGFDPETEIEKFVPFMAARNVTAAYPPTLMVHGTEDTDVPFLQSEIMATEFECHGVEHVLFSIEGGEHGLRGGDPDQIERGYALVESFLKKCLAPQYCPQATLAAEGGNGLIWPLVELD